MKVDLDACNEVCDSLFSEIKNQEKLNAKNDAIIKKHEQDNKVMEDQNKALETLKETYKKGEEKEKGKNKWAKGFATGFGIIAVVEAGWIYLTSRLQ